MRDIVFHMSAGFAGMDDTRRAVFDEDITDQQLSDIANELALDLADSYGVEASPDFVEDEDSETLYSDNIEGWWEEYNPDSHGEMEIESI